MKEPVVRTMSWELYKHCVALTKMNLQSMAECAGDSKITMRAERAQVFNRRTFSQQVVIVKLSKKKRNKSGVVHVQAVSQKPVKKHSKARHKVVVRLQTLHKTAVLHPNNSDYIIRN